MKHICLLSVVLLLDFSPVAAHAGEGEECSYPAHYQMIRTPLCPDCEYDRYEPMEGAYMDVPDEPHLYQDGVCPSCGCQFLHSSGPDRFRRRNAVPVIY